MKIFAAIFLTFMVAGAVDAQSAKLQFDPKWNLPKSERQSFSFPKIHLTPSQNQQHAMPRAWRYSDLAFFCKIEVKMEKATRFPIKFRLGDVHYVDQLEGKRPGY